MAKKDKQPEIKQEERVYTIPLRRDFLKAVKYKRSKRAMNFIRSFVEKHMKVENVVIGKDVNEFVWAKGIKNPPSKVRVKVVKVLNKAVVSLAGDE